MPREIWFLAHPFMFCGDMQVLPSFAGSGEPALRKVARPWTKAGNKAQRAVLSEPGLLRLRLLLVLAVVESQGSFLS